MPREYWGWASGNRKYLGSVRAFLPSTTKQLEEWQVSGSTKGVGFLEGANSVLKGPKTPNFQGYVPGSTQTRTFQDLQVVTQMFETTRRTSTCQKKVSYCTLSDL